MEDSKQASGGRPVDSSLSEKRNSPKKDESIGSGNPSPPEADELVATSANITNNQLGGGSSFTTTGPLTALSPQEHTYFYGGYDNSASSWDDYHRYANANNLQVVSPAMFSDNGAASVMYHSGFGIDSSQMAAYGQFSPMAAAAGGPMSPIFVDGGGQLFSPHHHQFPSFLPQSPHGNSQNEQNNNNNNNIGQQQQQQQERLLGGGDNNNNNNAFFGGSGGGSYYVPFGSFGEAIEQPQLLSNRPNTDSGSYMSHLTPPAVYPQTFGILGPYDQHNFGQFSPQQRPSHGFGTMTNTFAPNFPHNSSYQNLNYSFVPHHSSSNWRMNNQSRLTPDSRGGRRERDRDSVFISDDSHGDRNRGPRALKPKIIKTSSAEEEEISSSSVPNIKNGASVSESNNIDVDYNQPDFVTEYENAKFFVIKSYSEDNVHKSIKYNVWASTPLGNRKLDAAYHELKESKSPCPLFLLFSVNASGQFCGVAEMIGAVDFENDAEYWQQDRWSGQFPVRWRIIKDVPNSRFRHILLENNDNKPVTHSRDTQEVKLEQGIEILKIFKEHEAETSILDDFGFYDERERSLQERKGGGSRQQQRPAATASSSAAAAPDAAADVSIINQISDRFSEAFKLEDTKEEDIATPPK